MTSNNELATALTQTGFEFLRDVLPRNIGQGDASERFQIWLHPKFLNKWVILHTLGGDTTMYLQQDPKVTPYDALAAHLRSAVELVGVGVFLLAENHVLMSRRSTTSSFPGCWQNPGGKVEADESVLSAACREFSEEIGMPVDSARLKYLGFTLDNYPNGTQYIMHWYYDEISCRIPVPRNPEPHKHSDWEWLDMDTVNGLQQQGLLINSTYSQLLKAVNDQTIQST